MFWNSCNFTVYRKKGCISGYNFDFENIICAIGDFQNGFSRSYPRVQCTHHSVTECLFGNFAHLYVIFQIKNQEIDNVFQKKILYFPFIDWQKTPKLILKIFIEFLDSVNSIHTVRNIYSIMQNISIIITAECSDDRIYNSMSKLLHALLNLLQN